MTDRNKMMPGEGEPGTAPTERLDHIEQCLTRMRPTMGYELDGAATIRKELAALREIFANQDHESAVGEPVAWEEGETCS